ncbi:MAG: methyltransferase [Fibrobacteres bacterium]|nr:methyltransferase [Fibrobacterota bacterium]
MTSALCVVLVGPEQAANVGFVARTMACYGLADLRIVGSPGIAADGAARKTGKAVPEVLDAARYFSSLSDAISDCGSAYGFTRRSRDPSQRIEDLDPAARAWKKGVGSGISALVFGRESQGLFREETLLLTHLVRIPLPSETLSLNVSHALAIGLYAFLGALDSVPRPMESSAASAEGEVPSVEGFPTRGETAQAMEGMLASLEAGGFFKGGKQEAQKEYVRLLWQRMNPNRREFDFIAGLLRVLKSGR